jgi:Zn-dependent alcohol dehydrogenase
MYGESRRLADLVTHKFNLDNLEEAIATVSKGISVKAIVTP